MEYSLREEKKPRRWLKVLALVAGIIVIAVGGYIGYGLIFAEETVEQSIEKRLVFDSSLTQDEQDLISETIESNSVILENEATASAQTNTSIETTNRLLDVFVPATNLFSTRQDVSSEEFASLKISFSENTDEVIVNAIAELFDIEHTNISQFTDLTEIDQETVAFINESSLDFNVKLISLDGNYFLDTLNSGAAFREVVFSGEDAGSLSSLDYANFYQLSDVLKLNISGVTALTREMQEKLAIVGDPTFFSANIGEFLADADITHVSNEVSFLDPCGYSRTLFCSPPEFIETLKASGVDLVEITGNHNNDLGAQYNTETIELYRELGWSVVGGGLNLEDARKPYTVSQDGTDLAILAYNYPDSPNGGAIAGVDKAGANPFDFSYQNIEADIASAKQSSDFVIVNVQYWECYAYPDGYVEYPICDKPIGEQEQVFKKLIDLGADMVIGTSAHQPQTYELYQGKPIYYGLGNMYFEQTQWPGTERGIILSHYFKAGQLIQTKITPTVYNKDFQPRVMTPEESEFLLNRLNAAREN